MTARDFCFWLQGCFEVNKPETLGECETKMIKDRLSLVFVHEIDPSMGNKSHQKELDEAHSGQTYMNKPLKNIKPRC